MEEVDLVIVGAGVYGLPVAKTFKEVYPDRRMLILDAGESLGGTWSCERLYDDLLTNNLCGTLHFSDFPMDVKSFGVPDGKSVPGEVMHRYLRAYAEHFGFFANIRLGASVQSAELSVVGEWVVAYDLKTDGGDIEQVKVLTKKLVLATGLTSEPNLPILSGVETFGGQVFHSRDLPSQQSTLNSGSDKTKNAVVYGGSKSAADAAFANASRGVHVDWIIRSSGRGPQWLTPAFITPLHLQFEKLATVRVMGFLSPCLDTSSAPAIRRLLQNTRLGRAFIKFVFAIIRYDIISRGKYNDHPETKKLIPNSSPFWYGTSVGVFNYPQSLFGLVRSGMINVHIADIDSLSPHTVHLSNGVQLGADVLIYATGWKCKPNLTFFPAEISKQTGFTHFPPEDPAVQAADTEVFKRFPILQAQPRTAQHLTNNSPVLSSLKLYKSIVPPAFLHSHNLAYAGAAINVRNMLQAEIQALWIVAFLDGRLAAKLPSEAEAEWQALLTSRYYRWRVPMANGARTADMVFEALPYFDGLLADLGLCERRKGGWREWWVWYGVGDYRGVVKEWMAKEGL